MINSVGKGDESLQKILSNEKTVQQFPKFNNEHTDKVRGGGGDTM